MKKSKQKDILLPKLNLQLFAEGDGTGDGDGSGDGDGGIEDELFGEMDDIGTGEGEGEGTGEGEGEGEGKKPVDKKDWFMPGVAKTEKEAQTLFKKSKQYIKQLEIKAKEKEAGDKPPADAPPVQKAPKGIVEQAMHELGITDDDIAVDPVGTQKQLLEHAFKVIIPKTVTQPLLAQTGIVRGEIMKDKLRTQYPNFDIDKHEDKVADIVRARFSQDFIQRNPLKVFQIVVEELGGKGKKGSKPAGGGSGETFTEAPTITETSKRKAKFAQDIKDRIAGANIGSADLFNK